MSISFPRQPRSDDLSGHMVVWDMLRYLADIVSAFMAKGFQGTALIGATATSVNVVFGGSMSTYSVAITPLVDPTLRYWVSNKTNSGFRINLSAGAPAGGVSFDWIVKGA